MNRIVIAILLMTGFGTGTTAQSCHPDSLVVRSIKAIATSNLINWELQNHQVYFNPDCPSNEKLLLHLVGTLDNPASTTYFPILATKMGYKVISLKYPNSISGTTACRANADIDCHWKYRQEIIFGTDTSDLVSVDSSNCIRNRLEKLLIFLDSLYPTENWNQYLTSSNQVNWSDIVVSGHSQGGGHAAFIAKYVQLNRVIMFASPNEYSSYYDAPASWVSLPSTTPDSNYYAFGNLYDDIVDFNEQFAVWNSMELNTFGDSVCTDVVSCPFNHSRMLYTQDTSGTGFAAHHNAVVIDNYTPVFSGTPIFTDVWEYLLGYCQQSTFVSEASSKDLEIKAFPNPAHDLLYIENADLLNAHKISIYNQLGIKVFRTNEYNGQINISDLPEGAYYLKVELEGGTEVTRFIKL